MSTVRERGFNKRNENRSGNSGNRSERSQLYIKMPGGLVLGRPAMAPAGSFVPGRTSRGESPLISVKYCLTYR